MNVGWRVPMITGEFALETHVGETSSTVEEGFEARGGAHQSEKGGVTR
jgi:hypothetical protein